MKKLSVVLLSLLAAVMVLSGCGGGAQDNDSAESAENGAKNSDQAILIVSFGTSYNDSRDKTIGAIETAAAEAFPEYEVRRAFTSQIIIDKLKERDNLEIDNVTEALDRAVADGIKTLIVQPTHLMNGYEYTDLKEELETYRDKFEKIFFNLISNAFKYTPAEKAITIEVTKQTDKVTISVVDEGIGIEPTKLRTLFQRFETLAQQNMLQPSSGIGLSLVKEMVDMHHGIIKVTSEPEAGSRFMVTLPLQKEVFEQDSQVEFILNDSQSPTTHPDSSLQTEKRPEAEDKEDMENNAAPDTFTILVVEDNEELKAFLKNILSENYTVITAPNGKEGLQHAVDNIPDLIISDVMMPVMDGLEMIRKIKENNNICHIPIIVLSAKASLDDRIAGLEQGIDDYITKPFSATYLKTRIASLLRQRKSLQEIYMAKLTEGKEIAVAEALTPSQPQITPYDEQFMQKVMEFIEEQMDNAELTIDEFAEHLMLSRTIFYRKLKSIIGLTPVDFIREVRIKRAAQLIDSGEYNFSQVAYMTGFNDPKYFSKCFKKVVGITPSEYKEKNK